jgi:hypothetical protein
MLSLMVTNVEVFSYLPRRVRRNTSLIIAISIEHLPSTRRVVVAAHVEPVGRDDGGDGSNARGERAALVPHVFRALLPSFIGE